MKLEIEKQLQVLNSISIQSSLNVFIHCFNAFSPSLGVFPIRKIDVWIKKLDNQEVNHVWKHQRSMKHPEFIFYFIMWHFIRKTVRDRNYQRQRRAGELGSQTSLESLKQISKGINQEVSQPNPFEGIAFLGELIGAWLLTCPKQIVYDGIEQTENWQPNQAWRRDMFLDGLDKEVPEEELEILYILDYHLYYAFEHVESRNTE